jgi:DNA-binding winged helix-turn-helix (wHTH) protein
MNLRVPVRADRRPATSFRRIFEITQPLFNDIRSNANTLSNLAAVDDAQPTGSSATYHCGAIEIDALQREVSIDGTPARIGARAFDVLLALVERRERVVSKHELMDVVWPKLVVEENNLLVHIVALRKLLGPRAIVTIPGHGYRFALPVDTVNGGGSTEPALPAAALKSFQAGPLLLGRAQDLDAVEAQMHECMVLSIVGADGIGKTRLALAAAAAWCELPDGRWWVELAPITEGTQIPSSITGVLGTRQAAGRSPDQTLAGALASRNLLLVIN